MKKINFILMPVLLINSLSQFDKIIITHHNEIKKAYLKKEI